MADLENIKTGFLDRGSKFLKGWHRRFVTLEKASRRLLYSENMSKPPKGILLMKKITRTAEKNESLKPGNPDLYSFAVEGVDPEGKEIMWLLRCPDAASFDDWYMSIRKAIAAHGLMDPVHYGLPDVDPRCDLPIVTVPTEHLFRFSLLDKAIMYSFTTVSLARLPPDASGAVQFQEHILVLGDKQIYLFNFSADVVRCAGVASLECIVTGDRCIGLKFQHPQHDILFRTDSPVAIIDILRRTFNVATGQEVDVEPTDRDATELVAQLALRPHDGVQLSVSAPTPKMKLKHALDVYERQTGQPFVYGSAQNPAQTMSKTAQHNQAEAMDVEDPMAALLMRLKLTQYVVLMQRQHLDLDVLRCMEEGDLQSFGITDAEHRHAIIEGVRGNFDEAVIEARAASQREEYDDDDDQDAMQPAAQQPASRPMLVLDDSDDDLPMPSQKKLLVLDDDDDDGIVLPKKQLVLDDSDEDDLPMPAKPAAGGGANIAAMMGDDI